MEKRVEIRYEHFSSHDQLSTADRDLIVAARNGALNAISPYSNFAVGAALRTESGVVESAANVESEVYPAGICAERNLLFATAVRHPSDAVEAMAVTSLSSDQECYPCGLCRQTLLDTERRQGSPIRIIMAGTDTATVVRSACDLLPFSFKLQ